MMMENENSNDRDEKIMMKQRTMGTRKNACEEKIGYEKTYNSKNLIKLKM